jgi:hypothetical protein
VALASRNAAPPGPELTRALRTLIDRVNASDEQSTVVVDPARTLLSEQEPTLCELGGASYTPFVLAGGRDGAVAAVALSFVAGRRRVPPGELLAAVAEELVVRGDVTVIAG